MTCAGMIHARYVSGAGGALAAPLVLQITNEVTTPCRHEKSDANNQFQGIERLVAPLSLSAAVRGAHNWTEITLFLSSEMKCNTPLPI